VTTVKIDVPDDLLKLLEQSRLGARPQAERLKRVLALYLVQEGLISIGKAAEFSGEPRSVFERLLTEMDIPSVRYDEAEYERDLRGIATAKHCAV
jgi:predicted HTH domain antitoxin